MAFWSTGSAQTGSVDVDVDPADILGDDFTVVASNARRSGLVAESAEGQRYDFASDTESFDERKRDVLAKAAAAGVLD